jgi:Transposase DDE domain
MWNLLPKKGASNTGERIKLLNEFIAVFGSRKIKGLFGDREFIGEEWIKWLSDNGIGYVIRIKKDISVKDSKGNTTVAEKLFKSVPVGSYYELPETCQVWNSVTNISGLRLKDGTLLILITNIEGADSLELYRMRWQIETLFGCLKTRGFNMEDTKMTNPRKIKLLTAILALTFAWSYKTGHWCNRNLKTLRLKKHGRLEQSYFRYGLNHIIASISNNNITLLKIFLKLLNVRCATEITHHNDFDTSIYVVY